MQAESTKALIEPSEFAAKRRNKSKNLFMSNAWVVFRFVNGLRSDHEMNMRRALIVLCAELTLGLMAPPQTHASEFKWSETIYVIASLASVRTEPRGDAPVAGKLPIGTEVTYHGTPAEYRDRNRPRRRSDIGADATYNASRSNKSSGSGNEGAGTDTLEDSKWSLVCTVLSVDYGASWCGWIARDLLSTEKPKFEDLIAQYDKTPTDELLERRKWAERAAALDPLNPNAQQRLLAVLEETGDIKALEVAKRAFDTYRGGPTYSAGPKLVFSFQRGYLSPIAEVLAGRLTLRDFDQATNFEFRTLGRTYGLYSRGSRIGTITTEAQFNCGIQTCPHSTFARQASAKEPQRAKVGIATSFALVTADARTPREITPHEEELLVSMAKVWIQSSSLSPKDKKKFLKHIKQQGSEVTITIGSIGKERRMLIGHWAIGSMNDHHYGTEDDMYESLLIIAEEQADGTFRRAAGSGSIARAGCSYLEHVDIDGDDTDEVFLSCAQLEGQGSYAVARRVSNRWQISYGPTSY